MSPEQVQGNKTVDFRTDIWALGIIAFEMFTGQRPFTGNALGDLVLQICVRDIVKPSQLAPVPAGFDEWFARAAERDQELRFQSARELAQTLRDVVGGSERGTSLVVSDEVIDSGDRGQISVSAIMPSDTGAPVGKLERGSLELAETIFNPLGPPGRTRRVIGPTKTLALAAIVLGSTIALGIWYRSSKRVSQFRTSFVAASASTPTSASVVRGQTTSADVGALRTAAPSTRTIRSSRDKNVGNSKRLPGLSSARLQSPEFAKVLDASSVSPKAASSLGQPAAATSPTVLHATGPAASATAIEDKP